MKKLFIPLVFVSIIANSNAQTFSCSPNDSIVQDVDANSTTLLKIEQIIDPSIDTLQLEIEVIYNDIPNTWDGMVCIQGLCMGSIVPVGTEVPMVPTHDNLNGYVRLTVNPLGNTETVKYQVYVYDVNFPEAGDTVTWILNAVNLTEIEEDHIDTSHLFPNPAQNKFTIQSKNSTLNTVQIFNTSGQILQSHTLNNLSDITLDISALPKGIYYIQTQNNQGIINRQQLIKQ